MTARDNETPTAMSAEDLLASWLSRSGQDQPETFEITLPVAASEPADVVSQSGPAETEFRNQAAILERVLALWTTILGVQVTAADDFFQLGGTSLNALRACAQLSRQIDFTVPVRWLFEERVADAFTRRVETERAS